MSQSTFKNIHFEAKKYGYPTIEVTKSKTDLQAVLTALGWE